MKSTRSAWNVAQLFVGVAMLGTTLGSVDSRAWLVANAVAGGLGIYAGVPWRRPKTAFLLSASAAGLYAPLNLAIAVFVAANGGAGWFHAVLVVLGFAQLLLAYAAHRIRAGLP